MRWYWIALIVSLVIGPFDALYMYIKAQRRKDALKHKREYKDNKNNNDKERTSE